MWKKITGSFLLALHNIRSHFFHTLLSILGIVIGVAALVAILSLIDGLEKFAKDQIRSTSSLNAVMISSNTYKWTNDVRVRKDSLAIITYQQLPSLKAKLTHPANFYMWYQHSGEVTLMNSAKALGTVVRVTGQLLFPDAKAEAGRLYTEDDLINRKAYAIVNSAFIRAANLKAPDLIGKSLVFKNDTLLVIGVLRDTINKSPHVFFPITRVPESTLQTNTPYVALEATTFEDVNPIKEETLVWIKNTFPSNTDDFHVVTNDFRLKQAAQGFLLFRIVMGLIVGISVLVGGIGVMNVLLISVTQRTVEIGIRKAVGANKRDIILQFLSESIAVSAFGSLLGLVFGILGSMAVIPIIRAFVEVPFEAEYTWDTFILISIIAVVVGIVFGTYPALRASKLDPVEAIRRE